MLQRVVLDTSAFIEFLRADIAPLKSQVAHLIESDQIVSCPVVEYEILAGARPDEFARLEAQLNFLDYEECTRADHRHAAALAREMRGRGFTLKYTDLLIASFCIKRKLLLLTLDKDFAGIPGLERLAPNLP